MLLARGRGRVEGETSGQSCALDCAVPRFSSAFALTGLAAFTPPTSKRGKRRGEAVWCGGPSTVLGMRTPRV